MRARRHSRNEHLPLRMGIKADTQSFRGMKSGSDVETPSNRSALLDDGRKRFDELWSSQHFRKLPGFGDFPGPRALGGLTSSKRYSKKYALGPSFPTECGECFQIHLLVFRAIVKMPDCWAAEMAR